MNKQIRYLPGSFAEKYNRNRTGTWAVCLAFLFSGNAVAQDPGRGNIMIVQDRRYPFLPFRKGSTTAWDLSTEERVAHRLLDTEGITAGDAESGGRWNSVRCYPPDHDTAFYITYTHWLTTRFYFSKKYTALTIASKDGEPNLQYRPNTTLNMGVGVTYGWFTLNLALGFPFLNPGAGAKGKTRYLDLQTHIYPRKYIVDLMGEFYKGYYLAPQGTARQNEDEWYLRPDLKLMHLGVAAYRIINWEHFSFRAAMLQNEWQKRSAGSLLAGAEIFYGDSRADSAMVPSVLSAHFDGQHVRKLRYINIGPGLGYAYTLVAARHFFITGAATGNMAVSFLQEKDPFTTRNSVAFRPGLAFKAAAGYNSERWSINMQWVHHSMPAKGWLRYKVNTGNPRVNFVYRFMPGTGLKKKIRIFQSPYRHSKET